MKASCKTGDEAYLLPFACDGISDCTDGTDELEESCGQLCADSLMVFEKNEIKNIFILNRSLTKEPLD